MIKRAQKTDAQLVAKLAVLLWESHTEEELEREYERLFQSSEVAVFLFFQEKCCVGFAQCQLRHDYVEGTHSSPVGYLEGIFVRKEWRKKGIAGKLLNVCMEWAREKGCIEFSSDCEIDNHISETFHKAMGFQETNRIICFTKKLT